MLPSYPPPSSCWVGQVCRLLAFPLPCCSPLPCYTPYQVYRLLAFPDPDDPLEASLAERYRADRRRFEAEVRSYPKPNH